MTNLEHLTITNEELNGLTLDVFLRENFGDPTSDEEFENGDDADVIYVIEQEKKNHQVKQYENGRVTRLIKSGGYPQRHVVYTMAEVGEDAKEGQPTYNDHRPTPRRGQGKQDIDVPRHINKTQQRQHEKQYHPHNSL